MEQTAVKKLELKLLGIISFESEELRKKYKDAIEQAKQMEKDQITNAFTDGYIQWDSELTSEQYYNKQYNQFKYNLLC